LFEITATVKNDEAPKTCIVPAEQFPLMRWVPEQLGANAIIEAGYTVQDHVRAAIQTLSALEGVANRQVFAHTGWRRLEDGWRFLHAGGSIGPQGPETNTSVDLPGPLARVQLLCPDTNEDRRAAVRSSLEVLQIAPTRITVPLLGAVYRAVLSHLLPPDESVHLAGPTGVFKSELAALAQQHFGAEFDRLSLPASWSSTANSIERLAFDAKDILTAVDDFAPAGSMLDVDRLHATADRVFRGAGNRSARGRLTSGMRRASDLPPRGFILSTGEDLPRGGSLRSRIIVADVEKNDVDMVKLSTAQEAGRGGMYSTAMGAFVQWLARQFDDLKLPLERRFGALREEAQQSVRGSHRRTPAQVASLGMAWELFLGFAVDVGAVSESERASLWIDIWAGLVDTALEQAAHQSDEQPSVKFVSLVAAAILAGRAHVTAADGSAPPDPSACGWRADSSTSSTFEPRGDRVGWIVENDLYLDPDASFAVAQSLARTQGNNLGVTKETLWRRLREGGLLASAETSRGRNLVRKTVGKSRVYVLHVVRSRFMPSVVDSGPSGPEEPALLGGGDTDDEAVEWGEL
jgi:hypothetical protein